jgi:hypothetical protein
LREKKEKEKKIMITKRRKNDDISISTHRFVALPPFQDIRI